MSPVDYMMAGCVAMATGVDRVAFAQFMISRPLVAGPLAGLALGDPLVGLEVGMLLELLWLGRIPVGAAIPPDDTQVTVGATVLALSMEQFLGFHGMPMIILCVLVAIPLGKFGQLFDRQARNVNDRINRRALSISGPGETARVERMNLLGLASFATASLMTMLVIVVGGSTLLYFGSPYLVDAVRDAGLGLQYGFTLIGAAVLLGTINVNRGTTLFCAAFIGTLLVLWLR